MHVSVADRRDRFRALHARDELFLMPNPWDAGSARLLEAAGFEALATTSAGFAWSLGKLDGQVSRDELMSHLEKRGIGSLIHYPVPIPAQGFVASMHPAACPVATQICADVCSLPLYPQMKLGEQQRVASALGKACASQCRLRVA